MVRNYRTKAAFVKHYSVNIMRMRSLYHPRVQEITVEGILYALADPIRVQICLQLARSRRAMNCSAFRRIQKKTLPKSTLSQHFRILREAGLIHSERQGVELINLTRCGELEERFGPMIRGILDAYARQCGSAKK